VLNLLARLSPGARTLRPRLHRARGVKIGSRVFIGDEVYLDNEYPECIEIQEDAAISIRAIIIAHNKGPGKVIIEKGAFVGPHVIIACNGGRILRIGEGAVIGAGCVVLKSVPPHVVLTPAPAHVVGHAAIPLPTAKTFEEFMSGMRPLKAKASTAQARSAESVRDNAQASAWSRSAVPGSVPVT
jgi:serine acetyltransferase